MNAVVKMIAESSMLNENQKSLIASIKEVWEINTTSVKSLQEIYSKRLSLLKDTLDIDHEKQSEVHYFLDCLDHYKDNKVKYYAFEFPNRRISMFFDNTLTEVFFVIDDATG